MRRDLWKSLEIVRLNEVRKRENAAKHWGNARFAYWLPVL
jgi:hypothetical protein